MVPSHPTVARGRALLGMVAYMIALAPPVEKTMGRLSIFRAIIARRWSGRQSRQAQLAELFGLPGPLASGLGARPNEKKYIPRRYSHCRATGFLLLFFAQRRPCQTVHRLRVMSCTPLPTVHPSVRRTSAPRRGARALASHERRYRSTVSLRRLESEPAAESASRGFNLF